MTDLQIASVHCLLVDDLEENLLALEALLRRPNLVLHKARSGSEALEILLLHEIALALVDVQMPVMDGFELAELMRGTERTRSVPIIFVTAGNADWQRSFRGYEAGAVDFIAKPIEPHVLKSKAEVFFELYRQRQEVERLLAESRRQSAALQEADQRKDEFLAMLAHELRNPLAPVRNAVEILRLADTGNAQLDRAQLYDAREIISRQVSHMGRLIDDLLDVARISRGKMELRRQDCDLATIVRQTAEDYRPLFAAAELDIVVNIPNEPLIINGDPVRLAQVVGNLLHNASKFTPANGHVALKLAVDSAAKTARISIQDTGAGLEPAVLARLFVPFSQANQTLARSSGGLGLGLALAKRLVDLHFGNLFAESSGLGHGATFTIEVPLSVAPQRQSDLAPRVGKQSSTSGSRILIIEDNRDTAKTMQMLLRVLGHEVEVAYDGGSGIDVAQSFRPDIIFSDLGLPGEMDGYAVATAIRRDASLPCIYLIALSGYGQEEDIRKSRISGFDCHLTKPVEIERLKDVLADAATKVLGGTD